MWDTLKERTNSRLEALDRAREIHAFNRNVEETRAWIQEKEAALMFSDDGARDLSSVQALQRKHQGFQVSVTTGSTHGVECNGSLTILDIKIPLPIMRDRI